MFKIVKLYSQSRLVPDAQSSCIAFTEYTILRLVGLAPTALASQEETGDTVCTLQRRDTWLVVMVSLCWPLGSSILHQRAEEYEEYSLEQESI